MEQSQTDSPGRAVPKIGEFVAVLRKRKWIIIFAVLFSVTVAAYQSYTTPPTFMATASLVLESSAQDTSLIPGFYTAFQPYRLETELQIIQSRSICLGVVERLNLAFHPKGRLAEGAYFENPKVELGFPVGAYRLVEGERGFVVIDSSRQPLGEGVYGKPFASKDGLLHFVFFDPNPQPKRILSFTVTDPISEAEAIRQATTVRQAKDSNAFTISVSHTDPNMAAALANAVAEVYVEENLRWKRERARKAREFIGQQIEVAEVKLRLTEDLLREYKEELGIVSFSDEARMLVMQLSGNQDSRANLEMELAELEEQKRTIENYLAAGELDLGLLTAISSWPAFQTDQLLRQLTAKASELEVEKRRLKETGPLNPRLAEIDRELESLKCAIREQLFYISGYGSLAVSLEGLRGKIAEKGRFISRTLVEMETMPGQEMELALRERKSQVASKIHGLLLERYEEARINESMETGDVRIIDLAIRPRAPTSPNHTSDVLLGFAIGLVIGIALAMLVEAQDTTVKSAEEVGKLTGLSSLGQVPKTGEGVGDERLVVLAEPLSAIAEAYRIIRTNIAYFAVEKELCLLCLTSPGKGEGKTTTTANLGVCFAQQGLTTLIIDTDLRKAKMNRLFRVPQTPGFTELILGDASIDDVIRPTGVENLSVLPSGHSPPNPSELLSSKRTLDLLGHFKSSYAKVLLDTSPVLAVTDPAILSRSSDGTILVVEAESSEAEAVKEAAQLLRNARANLFGFVLNKVDPSRTYKSHFYYHYYHSDDDGPTKGSIWKRFRGKK
ncbi:MAG TPA: polysaccharide biosynthesis tyrosine autokinase [Candidatus Coatesbacteria bacterium]|nr:polysaccharide biosynthesis tyrosine autokinase [Candidatus Coatesbacteria bacterium]